MSWWVSFVGVGPQQPNYILYVRDKRPFLVSLSRMWLYVFLSIFDSLSIHYYYIIYLHSLKNIHLYLQKIVSLDDTLFTILLLSTDRCCCCCSSAINIISAASLIFTNYYDLISLIIFIFPQQLSTNSAASLRPHDIHPLGWPYWCNRYNLWSSGDPR